MDVKVLQDGQDLIWEFFLDKSDGDYTDKIKMVHYGFKISLPKGIDIKKIHPDHLGLITILAVHPFVGSVLNLPFNVSKRFSDATKVFTSYEVLHKGITGNAYDAPHNGVPSLAFSGGADSTACLLIMPKSTVSVFMDRPLDKKISMYNKTAAYATIKHAEKQGFEVHKISCDVEYIRQPLGFPTDLVPCLPILAIAKQKSIDSIAFGTVMESAYRIGHTKARNYLHAPHYKIWGRLFEAAGVPLFLPVAGISEVGTSMIVRESSFQAYTRSCIRGKWPNACENCWKCFRKNMLEERFKNGRISEKYLSKGLGIREVKLKLERWPISHENVLAWALQGSVGKYADVLLQRLEGQNRDLSYLESFYPPSIEFVPKKYQEATKARILSYLSEMDERFFKTVTEHNMSQWLISPDAIQAKKDFDEFMTEKYPVKN
tara:strand:+ start:967 stop:2262 length:1296 start_codon:yes stop_codon:yes gene_type:complete